LIIAELRSGDPYEEKCRSVHGVANVDSKVQVLSLAASMSITAVRIQSRHELHRHARVVFPIQLSPRHAISAPGRVSRLPIRHEGGVLAATGMSSVNPRGVRVHTGDGYFRLLLPLAEQGNRAARGKPLARRERQYVSGRRISIVRGVL